MQLKRTVNKQKIIGKQVYDLNNRTGVITAATDTGFTVKFKKKVVQNYSYNDIVNNVISFSNADLEDAILFMHRKQHINRSISPLVNEKFIDSDLISPEYSALIIEQWKAAIESATDVSNRRHTVNNFFMAIMTILTSGILFSDMFMTLSPLTRITISVIDGLLGIAICIEWKAQLKYYRDLCDVKYTAIRDMEKYLPIFIFNFEDIYFYSRYNDEKSFSKKESNIPLIFGIALVLIILIILYTSALQEGGWTSVLKSAI